MFLVIFLISAAFSQISSLEPTCRTVNFQIDEVIAACDYLMKQQGGGYWLDDFQHDLYPSIFGVNIPTKMSLEGKNGDLRPLNLLYRTGNSTACSTDVYERVDSTLKYDALLSKYDFNVNFMFLKATGTLIFKTGPVLAVTITNGRDGCKLDSYVLTDPGKVEYKITSDDDSWGSWLMEKLLHRTLVADDTTPMLSLMSKKLQDFVNIHFSDAWCTLNRLGVIN